MTISDEYRETLRKQHAARQQWGQTGARYSGDTVVRCLRERPYVKTVLDFGCGKGAMKPYLTAHLPYLTVSEYDPAIPGIDKVPSGGFDAVISSDVLEHIEPEHLDSTIHLLDSLTLVVGIHDIACAPAMEYFATGPRAGQNLHLIVEEPIWWRDRFVQTSSLELCEYHHKEKRSNKGYKPRCLLVLERTA